MRLLSIDGGGVRGALPARWLAALEDRSGEPIAARWDLWAGSSIGAALVCGLGAGMRAHELEEWLRTWAPRVFPGGLWGTLRATARLLGRPRYSPRGLEAALHAAFGGELRFGDLGPRPILVTGVAADTWCLRCFRSWRPEDRDLRVVDVLRASTAAPTYFPAARLQGRWWIDGGVAANHPGPEAIAEAWDAQGVPLDRIELLALGTGTPISEEDERDWGSRGAIEWAPDLVEAFMASQSARAHKLSRSMLGRVRYRRVQARLPSRLAPLDAAENMDELLDAADRALDGPAGDVLKDAA